jgi:hypothetical protein
MAIESKKSIFLAQKAHKLTRLISPDTIFFSRGKNNLRHA